MATFCGQSHGLGYGGLPHVDGQVSCSTAGSSKQLRMCSASVLRPPMKQLALPLLRSSASSIAGASTHLLLLRSVPHSRAMRRSQPGMVSVIKAAFIFEWIGSIIKFFTKTPVKLFAERLEADLDKAAKMIKTGARIVVEVAKEADEFAEKVESVAERAEKIAEKVAESTNTIEERIDEILDVIEGEKKLVVTSFKVVDNEDEVAVKSTTIAQDGDKSVVTVETTLVNDSKVETTNSP